MATESRLSTAAQFFADEEEKAEKPGSTYERVVDLLNQASLMPRDAQKITNLKMVQELIVNKEPALLDNFLDEMLAFQSDRSQDVKKFIVGFLEEACKKDPEILPKVIGNLLLMLSDDDAVAVQKKVILSMTQLYKVALQWVAKARKISEEMESTWNAVIEIKLKITEMMDSDNDGIRTHAVKFIESICIVLARKTADSEIPKKSENDISLDQVPKTHRLLSYSSLDDDGKNAFETMLQFLASPHISSVNLMTCMGSLTNIAKQRPTHMPRVVAAFEALHVNLPPTLAKSQVSSVRKNLKMQMLSLLRHPSSYDQHPQITTLLTDLGATQSEVMKAMPKIDESRIAMKRKLAAEAEAAASSSKRSKTEIPLIPIMEKEDKDDKDDDEYDMATFGESSKERSSEQQKPMSAIDITAEDLIPRLSPQNVADLVLLSMVMLPEVAPAQFQATYTPIAAAGTTAQIKHLARLLATQLTASGLGKGIQETAEANKKQVAAAAAAAAVAAANAAQREQEEAISAKHSIRTVVGGAVAEEKPVPQMVPPPPKIVSIPAPTVPSVSRKGIKPFKLSILPLDSAQMDNMAVQAFRRILKADKTAVMGDVTNARNKVLTALVAQYGGLLKDELQKFIFSDLRNRADLALAWIYQEYANYQEYNLSTTGFKKPTIASYDECLTRMLNGLLERPDQREGLFSRLLLEAPVITPNAIQVLRKYCQDETRIYLGMTTLKELMLKRPCMQLEFLNVLLEFTAYEKSDVRNNAIRVVKKLHERPDLKDSIEKYALHNLEYLSKWKPPQSLFWKRGEEPPETWTEDTIKVCLYLYLALLPTNHALIHNLAQVYVGTTPEIKRTILRILESPVKGMGMHSPELLRLVETCPKGAETLVTRIIHILTDKTVPSPELVERVRDLYQKRVSDVRFLIPVLNGLTQKEVIAALPKLIKLNPVVVKEVFNRLLGAHGQEGSGYTSPLSPSDLLVALHTIEQHCDMKTIIKATNLCFTERTIYTQEVLAMVMKQLMDITPLPTLLMRTVIQSLAMYPKLTGYVMSVLQRLIQRKVWNQKKVWEGFVKCCQRTKPQSFQVLLLLPAPQLRNAFEISPELREPLLNHLNGLTPHQRSHINQALMYEVERKPDMLQPLQPHQPHQQLMQQPPPVAVMPAPTVPSNTFVSMPSIKPEPVSPVTPSSSGSAILVLGHSAKSSPNISLTPDVPRNSEPKTLTKTVPSKSPTAKAAHPKPAPSKTVPPKVDSSKIDVKMEKPSPSSRDVKPATTKQKEESLPVSSRKEIPMESEDSVKEPSTPVGSTEESMEEDQEDSEKAGDSEPGSPSKSRSRSKSSTATPPTRRSSRRSTRNK